MAGPATTSSPLTTSSQAGRTVAYTVVQDGENGQALLVFDPADGRTVNSYPLPDATGWPVGVSIGHDRRVVTATSDGQVYGFAAAVAETDEGHTVLSPHSLAPTPGAVVEELGKGARRPAEEAVHLAGHLLVPAEPGQRVHGGHETDCVPTNITQTQAARKTNQSGIGVERPGDPVRR